MQYVSGVGWRDKRAGFTGQVRWFGRGVRADYGADWTFSVFGTVAGGMDAAAIWKEQRQDAPKEWISPRTAR